MSNKEENLTATLQKQMLKVVAKSFYKELIKYGVNEGQVIAVAGHLLDNLMQKSDLTDNDTEYYNRLFTTNDLQDNWSAGRRLTIQGVSITPLDLDLVPTISTWLREPAIRETFLPHFPDSEMELRRYFQVPNRDYFAIYYQQKMVGIIGAENIDTASSKLEMRKLVGDQTMQGKGIGKRATFLFLYHVFVIRKFKKVYLHSMDCNIRNLNINRRFGFELEGLFLEDTMLQSKWLDVVRMALPASVWLDLFSKPRPRDQVK
jgi:RimJ/RimL family protein N-acetyltransferase